MMSLFEENDKAAAKQEMEQGKDSVCYVCGKQSVAEGDLCHSCAQIISMSLKSLYMDEAVS